MVDINTKFIDLSTGHEIKVIWLDASYYTILDSLESYTDNTEMITLYEQHSDGGIYRGSRKHHLYKIKPLTKA